MQIELLCTHCSARSATSALREADAIVRCEGCGESSEFRQMHEAACASHRAEIVRRCPGLLAVLEPDWLHRSPLRVVDVSYAEATPRHPDPAKP